MQVVGIAQIARLDKQCPGTAAITLDGSRATPASSYETSLSLMRRVAAWSLPRSLTGYPSGGLGELRAS